MSDQRYTDALLANGKLREERDRLREALERLVDFINAYSTTELRGLSGTETMKRARAALAKEAGE